MSALLQINNISRRFGTRILLDKVTFSINQGHKIALIGRNGAGKSTLFQIILGKEEACDGSIIVQNSLRFGYLEQESQFKDGETLADFFARYNPSPEESWTAAKLAAQFGFSNLDLEKPVTLFSGGWQMRARLTAMMLTDPELILLDEPTNYLDLPTIILLERFLANFSGALILISHDREFLKRTTSSVLEINQKLTWFPKGLEDYFAFKAEQEQNLSKQLRVQNQKEEEINKFIDRFRAKASKAKAVQSKIKQLKKKSHIKIENPSTNVKINIPALNLPIGFAMEVSSFTIGYKNFPLVSVNNLELKRGRHVCIIGGNGEGKSTLLHTLAGKLPVVSGKISWSKKEKIVYYHQFIKTELIKDSSVEENLIRLAPQASRQEILDMAGAFLFSGKEIEKKISLLSGGEKARVQLAGLLLQKASVLLLDEPTNHLDFETVEILGDALSRSKATLVVVSHDRTFLSLVGDEFWEINSGDLKVWHNFEAYLDSINFKKSESTRKQDQEKSTKTNSSTNDYSLRKKIQKEIQQLKKNLSYNEDQQQKIKVQMEQLITKKWDQSIAEKVNKFQTELDILEENWFKIEEELLSMKKTARFYQIIV